MGTKVDRQYSWEEIGKHDKRDDAWIVIDGSVYDVSNFLIKHPGGSQIIMHYAGQDATEVFVAFHKNMNYVKKFLPALLIGFVKQDSSYEKLFGEDFDLRGDFAKLRKFAEDQNLFKASVKFFVLFVLHFWVLEFLAYFVLAFFGLNWLSFVAAVVLWGTAQTQAGWIQHDFGHLSVFKNCAWNRFFHRLIMGFGKGVSVHWWNYMHNRHHSKPNVINKDPDVRLAPVLLVEKDIAREEAKKKSYLYNYAHQHDYFMFVFAPLLFPIYFQIINIRHAIKRRLYLDLVCILLYFVKFLVLFHGIMGTLLLVAFNFLTRILESMWFTWVSQSNHIPMTVTSDKQEGWVKLQVHATCDIEQSWFNDWFTGHLNFQIEHHLFPTMPRCNYIKIAPYVRELCEKYDIKYKVKPLLTAFQDIVSSFKDIGETWKITHEQYHAL